MYANICAYLQYILANNNIYQLTYYVYVYVVKILYLFHKGEAKYIFAKIVCEYMYILAIYPSEQ